MARKKLGEILVESELLDELQLRAALGLQREKGGRLGEVLVKEGFTSEDEIAECLAAQLDLPRMDLYESGIQPAASRLLPREMAESHEVIPVLFEGEDGERGSFVWVATADPTNLLALDEVQFRTGKRVRPVVVTWTQLQAGIKHAYYGEPLVPPEPPSISGQSMGWDLEDTEAEAPTVEADEEDDDDDDDLPAIEVDTEGDTMAEEDSPTEPSLEGREVISAGIGSLLAGEIPDPGFRVLVSSDQLLSALLRLLSRKGVFSEEEIVEELQRK